MSRLEQRWLGLITTALLLAAYSGQVARADPCKAIPDNGPAPAYLYPGATFSGPVVYVGDGDSLCVARSPGPEGWIEVRLADFYAPELSQPGGPEAKGALERIAKGRRAICVADHQTYDRMAAACAIGGRDIGDMMRAAGVPEGGNGR
jgi:micrococcal nuclease